MHVMKVISFDWSVSQGERFFKVDRYVAAGKRGGEAEQHRAA